MRSASRCNANGQGPALLQRVSVSGFEIGIAVANTEYGVTLDHIRLSGQRRVGLANDGNAVAAADLTILAAGTAIANTAPGGLVVLTGFHFATWQRRGGGFAEPRRDHGIWPIAGRLSIAGGSPAPTFGDVCKESNGDNSRRDPT